MITTSGGWFPSADRGLDPRFQRFQIVESNNCGTFQNKVNAQVSLILPA